MWRYLSLLFVTLIVVGCTSNDTIMKSWIGSTDYEVMASWGAPDLESQAGNGNRVLTWNGRNGYGQIICRRTFVVNAEHRITSGSHNCPL
jgi:hypothetical protein